MITDHPNIRRTIRQLANVSRYDSIQICITDSDDAPHVAGESWHFETRGGKRIYHPSAYSKRGWSNMRYCCSTRRIEIGATWLQNNKSVFTS